MVIVTGAEPRVLRGALKVCTPSDPSLGLTREAFLIAPPADSNLSEGGSFPARFVGTEG